MRNQNRFERARGRSSTTRELFREAVCHSILYETCQTRKRRIVRLYLDDVGYEAALSAQQQGKIRILSHCLLADGYEGNRNRKRKRQN